MPFEILLFTDCSHTMGQVTPPFNINDSTPFSYISSIIDHPSLPTKWGQRTQSPISHRNQSAGYLRGYLPLRTLRAALKRKCRLIIQEEREAMLTVLQIQLVTVETLEGGERGLHSLREKRLEAQQ